MTNMYICDITYMYTIHTYTFFKKAYSTLIAIFSILQSSGNKG